MKLYFSPGACSLSPHIVLREAGYEFTTEKVDLKSRRTADGTRLADVHAKDYVPILELDSGERLTEGPAIVQYLAERKPESGLMPEAGTMERHRVREWLNYITSELHKSFFPLFHRDSVSKDWQEHAERRLARRLDWISGQLAGRTYLVGERFTVADAYLFTVINWTGLVGLDLNRWPGLSAYRDRIAARPSVLAAMEAEGLRAKPAAA